MEERFLSRWPKVMVVETARLDRTEFVNAHRYRIRANGCMIKNLREADVEVGDYETSKYSMFNQRKKRDETVLMTCTSFSYLLSM